MKMIVFAAVLFFTKLQLGAQDGLAKYTVYYFLGEDCKICQFYSPLMNSLANSYSSDSLSFIGLFPNRYSTEKGIKEFREKYLVDFELKREYFGTKTKAFGVSITPEVVVYNELTEQILYKGRIDNSYYKVGRQRRVDTTSELEDVLRSIINGKPITTIPEPAIGCYITFK